jgi:hypothetical protein
MIFFNAPPPGRQDQGKSWMPVTIGVLKETVRGENRVAVVA